MNRNRCWLFLASLAFVLQIGCAFTKETIHIEFKPTVDAPKVAGAENIQITVVVKDRRPEQTLEVARKINGFGSECAPILNDEEIAGLVKKALSQELALRGYKVDGGAVSVHVEVLGFTHKYNTGFFSGDSKANVTLLARIRDAAGKDYFEKTATDTFSHAAGMFTGANVKQAYEVALPGAIRKIVDDPEFQAALVKAKS